MALPTLQLGNITATPNANTTPQQQAAALNEGYTPVNTTPAGSGSPSSTSTPSSQSTPASSGSPSPSTPAVPNTPTNNNYVSPASVGSGGVGAGYDPGYDQAEADTEPMSEDQIYAYYAGKSAAAIASAQETESAAEQEANIQSTQETSQMNYNENAAGMAGSSEASAQANQVSAERNQAITAAQAQRDSQLATIYANITTQAASDFQNEQNTVAPAYIAQKQKNLQTSLAGLASQGMSLTQLQTENPTAYAQLLQYANGDPNALTAMYVQAASANLMNGGQPVITQGNSLTYMTQTIGADGQPVFTPHTVNVPNLPQGYKVTGYNQAANGTVTWIAYPTDAQGNPTVLPDQPNNGIISGTVGGGSSTPIQGLTSDQQTALNNLGLNSTDQELVVGIATGTTPPPSGFGANSAAMLKVKAGLVAIGFNTTVASEDYTAMQDYMSTMNSSSQIRLKQAAISVPPMLTSVQSIFNDFQSQAPQWGITTLNSASLAAAVSGAYGSDAQTAAANLQQQITDITTDLGIIYKGGNSATDQSLQSGASQLQGTWDADTFTAALNLIQQNIGYRVQAINAVGVGGVGGSNPYASMVGVNTGTPNISSTVAPSGGSSDGSSGSSDPAGLGI